jgi:hypothetical protein
VTDHHTTNKKLLTDSGLVQLLHHIAVFYLKKIKMHLKSGSFKPLELTAELGTKLMNFLRELNKVNVTFHLQKLSASGKADLNSLQNVNSFKNYE